MPMKTTTEQKPISRQDETIPEQAIKAPAAAHSDSQSFQDDSTKFREDILRRYGVPFGIDGWLHGGLNE